jgi:FMN-dependent oxidoreductase (nitrilotriacetate monooxygenase family)
MAGSAELHLNLNFLNAGTYGSAWRWPGSDPKAFADIKHYVRTAQLAEKGTFDAVFLADNPGIADNPAFRPFQSLEPTVILAMIAALTERIGLIATLSTTYNEPYNVARRFASLDHASGGRAGWNIVTTADVDSAHNFGIERPAHDDRYKIAEEFVDVVRGLWDSWDDDAFVRDRDAGLYFDPAKVHALNHVGEYFKVRGPLN